MTIALQNVTVRRRGSALLNGVTATLARDGVTAIMGANGAGKTTLLRAIHGLERLNDGAIHLAPPLTQDGLALLLQQPILMRRSVRDNVAYPLRLSGIALRLANERADAELERAGLTRFARRDPATLSGGERQKMALARALVREPACLLLDEPTANLDAESASAIEATLTRAAKSGTKLLIVTHNAAQAQRLAQDILILDRGRMAEHSPLHSFTKQPESAAGRACLAGDF